MTLAWWATQLCREYPPDAEYPGLRVCYIAVVPNINDDGTHTYHLEVEIEPFADLIGTYDTGIRVGDRQLEEVLNSRRRLGEELAKLGVKVYATREEWEKTLDEPEATEAGS